MRLETCEEQASSLQPQVSSLKSPASSLFLLLLVFCVALGVRVLAWQDTRFETERTQAGVTADYKHAARALVAGGPGALFSLTSPLADPNTLGHPPGYPALLALVYAASGESDHATQLVQIVADSFASVVVLLIVSALALGRGAALAAGLLAALSPQFTWNAVQILPDTWRRCPCCSRSGASRSRSANREAARLEVLAAGALVGLSVWLRANAMLLAPFLAAAVFVLFERGRRVRYALAVVAGTLLLVAPLTLRNAYVFGHFVPVSLGAGQTLLEGIGDYDPAGRLGVPSTDTGIQRMEAEQYARPDYAATLFGPDAVPRERARLRLGWSVIRKHPLWFGGVMASRAASMLKLERARRVGARPPVSHALDAAEAKAPEWSSDAAELARGGQVTARGAQVSLTPDVEALQLSGDESEYGEQFVSAPFGVSGNTDYVLRVPYRIARGRMSVSVREAAGREHALASSMIEPLEGKGEEEQPFRAAQLAFMSGDAREVRLVFANAASAPLKPLMQVARPELYALGEAAHLWTRAPRWLVSNAQKLFVTALMLPLYVAGFVLLWRAKAVRSLLALLTVPVYYFCAQSALHTEYRYVLVIHYFLFVLAAVSLCRAGDILSRWVRALHARRRGTNGNARQAA